LISHCAVSGLDFPLCSLRSWFPTVQSQVLISHCAVSGLDFLLAVSGYYW